MNYSEAMNFIANTSRFGMNFGLSRSRKNVRTTRKSSK